MRIYALIYFNSYTIIIFLHLQASQGHLSKFIMLILAYRVRRLIFISFTHNSWGIWTITYYTVSTQYYRHNHTGSRLNLASFHRGLQDIPCQWRAKSQLKRPFICKQQRWGSSWKQTRPNETYAGRVYFVNGKIPQFSI